MRRAFIFTAALLAAAAVLYLAAYNAILLQSDYPSGQQLVVARKLSYSWDDVREDLKATLNLSIARNGENLTVSDNLPAPKDISRSLRAYSRFMENYYRQPELNFSFLNSDGSEMALEELSSPLQILPAGVDYSYPDNGKRELDISVDEDNFSQVKQVNMTIVMNRNFSDWPFGNPCNDWSPRKTCTGATDYCFTYWVKVIDANQSTYSNTAACSMFDVEQNSNLQLDLAGGGWVKILIGELPDLVTVRLNGVNVSTNTTFTFNTTSYTFNYATALKVRDSAFNASKTLPLSN